MIGYEKNPSEEILKKNKTNYSIWRLMIDKDNQGKGYGKEAIRLAINYIETFPCGEADSCFLSYEPKNIHAKELYQRMGLVETDEMDEEEIIAIKPLKKKS